MNQKYYKWVVGFIVLTIMATIMVQLFWNYREYEVKKQNLVSRVQLSLDNAVEAYYANLTRLGIVKYNVNLEERTDTIIVKTASRNSLRQKLDSTLRNISDLGNQKPILIQGDRNRNYPFYTSDSLLPANIDSLISKVFISISRDSVDLKKLDTYLSQELERHKLTVDYALVYTYNDRINEDSTQARTKSLYLEQLPKNPLKTTSKSTFLPRRGQLELLFSNSVSILLKESLGNIMLSLILSIGLIASLLYLLKTIYNQKQLSEVKNDLISNITHEFKTPISTISAALEGIKSFNKLDNKVKTEEYLNMSSEQLNKLNLMVEKLLETASLDSGSLQLEVEDINIGDLLQVLVERYQRQTNDKTITLEKTNNVSAKIDRFHFENAISNIIDNAVKYGGKNITVQLKKESTYYEISITDNGTSLTPAYKDKIFEQFYRVPKGNTHDVKGFGIGLFYTKKIIEKHIGSLKLELDKRQTTFKISMPNV